MSKEKLVTLRVGSGFLTDFRQRIENASGRFEEVVMVVRRPGGKLLVAGKTFYPPGTLRLLTGKIGPGESPWEAFERELREETGFATEGSDLLGTVRHRLTDSRDEVIFLSHVFVTPNREGAPRPADAGELLTGFRDVRPDELRSIADQLRGLPKSWKDWGRFRAEVVVFVVESLPATDTPKR